MSGKQPQRDRGPAPVRREVKAVRKGDPVNGQYLELGREQLAVLFPGGRVDQFDVAPEEFACGCDPHERSAGLRCGRCQRPCCAQCPRSGYSSADGQPLCGECSRHLLSRDGRLRRVSVDQVSEWRWSRGVRRVVRALLSPFVRLEEAP